MEGIRLSSAASFYRESTVNMTVDDGDRLVQVKVGDRICSSIVGANREAAYFPNPNTVDVHRPLDRYLHYGVGPHTCLGAAASRVALTAMLRTVGRLNNLRRAPGPQGQLKKVSKPGGSMSYMRADHGGYFPFPTS